MQYSEIKPSLLKINNWKELLMKKNGKQKEQPRHYLNKYCLDLYLRKGFRVDSLWLCDNKTIIFNPQTCRFQPYKNELFQKILIQSFVIKKKYFFCHSNFVI